MMNLDIFAGNNVMMNLDILAEDNANDVKEILSGSKGKTICIISIDHFVGLVTKMDQNSLGLMNVVTIEGGAECLPDPRLMGEDRAYRKLKRYVESDRQMDSTITLDDKAYSCREVEALYYDAKENISKLIGSLQKILADAGFEEDEAVYVIGGIRTLDYLIMHYCREELSANALMQDKRIHVDPSDTLYECMKEAISEYNSRKEAGSTETGGGQTGAGKTESGEPKNKESEKKIEAVAAKSENGSADVQKEAGIAGSGEESGPISGNPDAISIFVDPSYKEKILVPKEDGQWHKVELSTEYFVKPLRVQIYRKTYEIDLPFPIFKLAVDCFMADRKTFIIEAKFWGETYAENHLYLRGDSSCMGPDNMIYHYDFSHPQKTS